jgi:hypothetical protein
MTNGDWIRAMSDEELADWLENIEDQWDFCNNRCTYNDGFDCVCIGVEKCREGRLEWLKQEVGNER